MSSIKQCSRCGKNKKTSEFSKNKRYKDGYQSYCKKCVVEYGKDWDRRNPNKRKAAINKWRNANKELVIKLATEWNKLHPKERRESKIRWNKNHPHQVRLMEKNRELREKNAPGEGVTEAQWQELLREYNYRCAYCGNSNNKLELEHVVPLSKGGHHEISNIVPACRRCNARKSSNPLLLFMYKTMENQ